MNVPNCVNLLHLDFLAKVFVVLKLSVGLNGILTGHLSHRAPVELFFT